MEVVRWVSEVGVAYPARIFPAALRARFPDLSDELVAELAALRQAEACRRCGSHRCAHCPLAVDNSVETVDNRKAV